MFLQHTSGARDKDSRHMYVKSKNSGSLSDVSVRLCENPGSWFTSRSFLDSGHRLILVGKTHEKEIEKNSDQQKTVIQVSHQNVLAPF